MPNPPCEATKRRRVYLVDDCHWVRRGLEVLIGQEPDLEVCGGADNIANALAEIGHQDPDIAIIDLRLKAEDGADLVQHLRRRGGKVKILVFSIYHDAFHARKLRELGADGYMSKREKVDKVVPALRVLLSGRSYMTQDLPGARA